MGSGYYQTALLPPGMRTWNKEQHPLRSWMSSPTGSNSPGIRPGVIGEIGMNDLDDPLDILRLRSGCGWRRSKLAHPLHPPNHAQQKSHQILDVLEEEGADWRKWCCVTATRP